jgi:hypothetical protein
LVIVPIYYEAISSMNHPDNRDRSDDLRQAEPQLREREWQLVTSVIIGAKRLDQLQDNLAAVEITLAQDELRQLDEVSALPPEYPGWMLLSQGADRLQPVDRWERFREASNRH